ncbi:hypothetical protein VIBNIMADA3020_70048 [Vibrio nigripulchritudo MADA3020]|nr:hypothetical protein VIBNIMADA3020_70048 [Vibrio nigripulchritudo MADA3020]CCN56259.1 hypothetical protein VIBNIMADA3021_910048 [Vibrio nigripulchritudo MADA3021]
MVTLVVQLKLKEEGELHGYMKYPTATVTIINNADQIKINTIKY